MKTDRKWMQAMKSRKWQSRLKHKELVDRAGLGSRTTPYFSKASDFKKRNMAMSKIRQNEE